MPITTLGKRTTLTILNIPVKLQHISDVVQGGRSMWQSDLALSHEAKISCD